MVMKTPPFGPVRPAFIWSYMPRLTTSRVARSLRGSYLCMKRSPAPSRM